MRGFVFDDDVLEYGDDDELDLKSKIRQEMVEKLAAEWNQINRKIEERSWRSRDERDDEADYYADRACDEGDNAVYDALKENPNLSEEEQNEIRKNAEEHYYKELDKKNNEIYLRRDVIEDLLRDLGARMMRPYEHWNEDERYYEYMENRYDDDRDWDY